MRLNYVFSAGLWLGVCAAGFWYVGCGGSAFGDCADTNTCGADASITDGASPPEASSDSGTVDVVLPPVDAVGGDSGSDSGACDPTLPPASNPCVVSFAYGVFVSTTGTDTGDGSKLNPFRTITVALTHLGGKRHVFVCGGTYQEHVKITNAADGIGIYGGLDCSKGWTYAGNSAIAFVSPMDEGLALEVDGLATGLLVSDFGLSAITATSSGASSIAAFVNQSNNVNFVRVAFKAQDGTAGLSGTTNDTYSAASASPGNSPNASMPATGGAAQTCPCADGSVSVGGSGGSGGTITGPAASMGSPGSDPITPPNPPGNDGSGGSAQATTVGTCTNGATGSTGLDGMGGAAPNASNPGTIGASGWVPLNGNNGTSGETAQGGGGGGGGLFTLTSSADSGPPGGGGGGGACGGCGGGPGTGGQAGGSSIALMVYSSTAVSLDSCTLVIGNGANGGNGGNGQPGQSGGTRVNGSSPGCPGGKGGNGGGGGGGGAGAGGCSIGIAYRGPAPVTSANTPPASPGQVGKAGRGGTGGTPGGALDGIAVPTMSF